MHTLGAPEGLKLGLMAQPNNGYRRQVPRYPRWAADNGCFSQGGAFDVSRYLSWLSDLVPYQRTCLFAVAPDVYGDANATLLRSAPVLPVLREMGYRAALVAQDGLTPAVAPWDSFDVLFLGGTDDPTPWKESLAAWELAAAARRRGKWVHNGRVNTWGRLQASQAMQCDSADGTFLRYGPDVNWPILRRWLLRIALQPALPLESVS